MSKLVAVRIPDELLVKMDALDLNRSRVIIEALEMRFSDAHLLATRARRIVGIPPAPADAISRTIISTPVAPSMPSIYDKPAHHPACKCPVCSGR